MEAFWIILTAALVAVNCSLLGSFLMLRRAAMLGDALSHAVLPGIVIAFLFTQSLDSWGLLVGASSAGMLATLLISVLQKRLAVQSDAAIGLIFTCFFALGIVLISAVTRKVDLDQECVLYGEIAYVPYKLWVTASGRVLGPKAIYLLSGVLVFNLGLIITCYKPLQTTTFDENFARSLGMRSTLWHYVLMGATSLTTVAAFSHVGAILVIAFLVAPPATAYLLTQRLPALLATAAVIGALVATSGYFLAMAINGTIAGAMATMAGVLFVLALAYAHWQKH